MIERDRRGGVAGDDGEARVEALDQPAEQGRDAAGDLGLAALAVGKAGAVGGVDDRRVGQQRARRPEHRQAADAGIEEEERGGVSRPFGRLHAGVASAGDSRKLRARSGLLPPRP